MPEAPEIKPEDDKFTHQVMSSLRKENRELEMRNRGLLSQLARLENNRLKHEQRTIVAEDARESLFDAVRVLAEQVSKKTARGKRARQRARLLLESRSISPPATLGGSRDRNKTRKKSKKKKRKS